MGERNDGLPGGREVIIGVAGEICSGKDSVAEHLAVAYGFEHVSLSRIVAEKRERVGLAETRLNQLDHANRVRAHHGGDFFVKSALMRARESGKGQIVLSGIYCTDEAQFLAGQEGAHLLAVVTPDEDVRFRRLRRRFAKSDRSSPDSLSFEDFRSMTILESSGNGGAEPNVARVVGMAPDLLINSGTLDDLRRRVDEYMAERHPVIEKAIEVVPPHVVNTNATSVSLATATLELQRRHVALAYLASCHLQAKLEPMQRALAPLVEPMHAAHQIGNQFGVRLLDAYMVRDPHQALRHFKSIEGRTLDEEMVLLANDTQFLEIHGGLHAHLEANLEQIHDDAVALVDEHRKCNEAQFRYLAKRSLEVVRQQGVEASVMLAGREELRSARERTGSSEVPVTEALKNSRILAATEFEMSKISHVIHDFVDHAWLFDLLDRTGVFERHRELLRAVGNPEAVDLFRREGEMVASIGFGVRLWGAQQVGFVPLYSIDDMLARLDLYFESGRLATPELLDIYCHLRNLCRHPSRRESQSLAFAFSNYLVELDEQRRKHGEIMWRDPKSMAITGVLDPWSLEYLLFFIDVHRSLHDSHNKHRDNLLKTHILVEEFLCSEAALDGYPLTLRLGNLSDSFGRLPDLPPERIVWMARHYGFSAVREPII